MGGGFFGRLGLLVHEGIEVAGAVGILDDLDGRGIDGDFVDLDRAADDAPEAVAQADFIGLEQGFGAGGADLELAEEDLGKGAERSVANGDFCVHGLAHTRENDAFEKRRTGGYKIEKDEQDQEGGGKCEQSAGPATTFDGFRGCSWVCHKGSAMERLRFDRILVATVRFGNIGSWTPGEERWHKGGVRFAFRLKTLNPPTHCRQVKFLMRLSRFKDSLSEAQGRREAGAGRGLLHAAVGMV